MATGTGIDAAIKQKFTQNTGFDPSGAPVQPQQQQPPQGGQPDPSGGLQRTPSLMSTEQANKQSRVRALHGVSNEIAKAGFSILGASLEAELGVHGAGDAFKAMGEGITGVLQQRFWENEAQAWQERFVRPGMEQMQQAQAQFEQAIQPAGFIETKDGKTVQINGMQQMIGTPEAQQGAQQATMRMYNTMQQLQNQIFDSMAAFPGNPIIAATGEKMYQTYASAGSDKVQQIESAMALSQRPEDRQMEREAHTSKMDLQSAQAENLRRDPRTGDPGDIEPTEENFPVYVARARTQMTGDNERAIKPLIEEAIRAEAERQLNNGDATGTIDEVYDDVKFDMGAELGKQVRQDYLYNLLRGAGKEFASLTDRQLDVKLHRIDPNRKENQFSVLVKRFGISDVDSAANLWESSQDSDDFAQRAKNLMPTEKAERVLELLAEDDIKGTPEAVERAAANLEDAEDTLKKFKAASRRASAQVPALFGSGTGVAAKYPAEFEVKGVTYSIDSVRDMRSQIKDLEKRVQTAKDKKKSANELRTRKKMIATQKSRKKKKAKKKETSLIEGPKAQVPVPGGQASAPGAFPTTGLS